MKTRDLVGIIQSRDGLWGISLLKMPPPAKAYDRKKANTCKKTASPSFRVISSFLPSHMAEHLALHSMGEEKGGQRYGPVMQVARQCEAGPQEPRTLVGKRQRSQRQDTTEECLIPNAAWRWPSAQGCGRNSSCHFP